MTHGTRERRSGRLVATMAAAALTLAGCSSTAIDSSPSDADVGDATAVPAATVADATLPSPDEPKPAEPEPTPAAADEPSQSAEDADRDLVIMRVAALTFDQRVEVVDEIRAAGQTWVISRLPRATVEELTLDYFTSVGADPIGGELLQIEDGRIARAIPMSGYPPTFLVSDDQLVFAGRTGDGGYPNSALVRVDLTSGDVQSLVVPFSFDRPFHLRPNDSWEVAGVRGAEGLWSALQDLASGPSDDPAVRAEVTARLESQFHAVERMDFDGWPILAFHQQPCDRTGWDGSSLMFDHLDRCSYVIESEPAGEPTVSVAGRQFQGTLVGAGIMNPQQLYAAVVGVGGTAVPTSTELFFVDVSAPDQLTPSGVVAPDDGSTFEYVSFFDGGFVVTSTSDSLGTVTVYDATGSSVDEVLSGGEPRVAFAAMSPNGQRLTWIERNLTDDGLMAPGAAIVTTDYVTGGELQRIEFDLDPEDRIAWVDFDGRFAALSFAFSGEGAPTRFAFPILIDTMEATIYPLGIDLAPIVTFERPIPAGG